MMRSADVDDNDSHARGPLRLADFFSSVGCEFAARLRVSVDRQLEER